MLAQGETRRAPERLQGLAERRTRPDSRAAVTNLRVSSLLEIVFHKTGDAAPDATICLPAWNREAHVVAALSSALSQRLCRVEIVVSDDCSADGTLAAALSLAKGYRGPHAVVVCRAARRLRTLHKPAVAALATAPVIVNFDSDDVSHPERVARLLAVHRRTGAALVSTPSRVVEGGRYAAEPATPPEGWLPPATILAAGTCDTLMGAKYSQTRELFTAFPPLDWARSPVPPDSVLPFRALLLGGAWYHDEVLLDRHIHPGRWSARQDDAGSAASRGFSLALRRLQSLRVMRRDLAFATEHGLVDAPRGAELGRMLERDSAAQLEALLECRAALTGRFLEPVWVDAERLAETGSAP